MFIIFYGRTKANTSLSQEEAYTRIRSYGYEPLEPYVNNRTRIACLDAEGYIVKISVDSLGRCKSYQRFSPTSNAENFINNLNLYGRYNNYSSIVIDYKPSVTPKHYDLICVCECGNIFTARFENWKMGNKNRCNICSSKQSNLEYIVKQFLKNHKIVFCEQYKFTDCKDKRCLPFDFYLPDYNMCIEVDGEQHYHFHSKFNSTQQIFADRQHKDLLKDTFCNQNFIKLIRLKYNVIRNGYFKTILQQELNLH